MIFFIIWLVGYIPTMVFLHRRLMLNHRRGFIVDPYDPYGLIVMWTKGIVWPYVWYHYCRYWSEWKIND